MLKHLLRKEFKLFIHTPLLLWMNTLYPIVILGLLPFATTMEIKHLNTVIINQDGSQMSKDLAESFYQSGYFEPVKDGPTVTTFPQAMQLMHQGKADIIVTIPKNFERDITDGQKTNVAIAVDAVNASKGTLGNAYAQLVVKQYKEELAHRQNPEYRQPVEFRQQKTLYNPELDYHAYVIPGLMAVVISFFSMIMPAISLVQEKEYGTIEQLNVTPVKPHLVLLSKAIPYWILLSVLTPIMVYLVDIIYGVHIRGSIWAIELNTLLITIAFSGLGLTFANYSSRLQQLMFVLIFVIIVLLLMSGIFLPIGGMPLWARVLAHVMPLYYYVVDLRSLFLRGASILDVQTSMLVLSGFAVIFWTCALISYSKRSS